MMRPIRIAMGNNLWTRAIVADWTGPAPDRVTFHFDAPLPDRLYGVRDGRWDGSDGAFTDYILDKSRGRGVPRVALPVFSLGGLRQRTLIMRKGEIPGDLKRGSVALVPRVLTAGGVYVRGLLADEYGLGRFKLNWCGLHPAGDDAEVPWLKDRLGIPQSLSAFSDAAGRLLERTADLMVHPGGAGYYCLFGGDELVGKTLERYPDLHTPLGNAEALASWFRREQVYPIVHAINLRADILDERPVLAGQLTEYFQEAFTLSEQKLDRRERDMLERERAMLNFDPYRHTLGPVQVRTLATLMRYLRDDGLVQRDYSPAELFPHTQASGMPESVGGGPKAGRFS